MSFFPISLVFSSTPSTSSLFNSSFSTSSEQTSFLKKAITLSNEIFRIGNEAFQKEEYEKASLAFKAVISINPNNSEAKILFDHSCEFIEKIKALISLLLKGSTDCKTAADKFLLYTKLCFENQRFAEASQAADISETLITKNIQYSLIRSRLEQLITCPTEFQSLMQKISHIFNTCPELKLKVVNSLSECHQYYRNIQLYAKSIEFCNHALELDNKNLHALERRAELHELMGNTHAARNDYWNLLKNSDEEHIKALIYLQEYYTKTDREQELHKCLIIFLKHKPRSPQAWRMLTIQLAKSSNYKLLLKFSSELLKQDSNNILALEGHLLALSNLNKVELNSHLEMLLKIDPNNLFGLSLMSNQYYVKNQNYMACSTAIKLLSIQFNNFAGHFIIGSTLSRYGFFEMALKAFNTSLSLAPNEIMVLCSRSNLYRKMCKFEEALKDLNTILSLDPNNFVALKIQIAIAIASNEFDKLENLISQLLNISNSNKELINIFDECNTLQGKARLGKVVEILFKDSLTIPLPVWDDCEKIYFLYYGQKIPNSLLLQLRSLFQKMANNPFACLNFM